MLHPHDSILCKMSAHPDLALNQLNSDSGNRCNELTYAARIGHLEYLQVPGVAESLEQLSPGERAALLLTAVSSSQHEVADWLLSGCCGDRALVRWVNAERVPVLVLACRNHMYSVAERLIEAGVDVNMRPGAGVHATALHMLLRGFHNIVQPGHAPRDHHRRAFTAIYSAAYHLAALMADTGSLHIDIADGRGRTVEAMVAQRGYLGPLAPAHLEEQLRGLLRSVCLPPRLSCLAARACARDLSRASLLPPCLLRLVVLHLLPRDLPSSLSSLTPGERGEAGRGAEALRQAGRALRQVFLPARKKSSCRYKSHD